MDFTPGVLWAQLAPRLAGAGPLPLAVALSGGRDSAALLAALAALAAGEARLRVRALHVNHRLTAAAPALEAAARALAARFGVPFLALAVQVEDAGEGREAAARRARYAALGAALAPGESLLVAHHLEDQAETLLLQLLRGAGPKGLAAMPARAPLGDGQLLRPLLGVSRDALAAYARAHALAVAHDPMNDDPSLARSYLRHAVLPLVARRWPAFATTLARSAGHLAEAAGLLAAEGERLLASLARGAGLDVAGLLALAPAERRLALRTWLAALGLPMPSAAQLARLSAEVLGARAGRAPRLRLGAHELTRHAGVLYAFRPLPPAPAAAPLPAPGAVLDMGVLGALHVRATVGRGLALGRGPFRMGPRAGGERLARVPGGPRRPLKDWLREAGLPPWARARALLVAGDALAAVVLPHATWVAAEARALGAEPGVEIEWRDAPAVLLPVPCTAARVEPEAPFR